MEKLLNIYDIGKSGTQSYLVIKATLITASYLLLPEKTRIPINIL